MKNTISVGFVFSRKVYMPNDLKNTLNSSASFPLSRQLPVVGASSGPGMAWTLSGLALASCIGGGGGGGSGGASVSGYTEFTRSGSGQFEASRSEVNAPLRFNSSYQAQRAPAEPQSIIEQLAALGATYSHGRRIDDQTAMYMFDVENDDRDLEYRAVLGGADGNKFRYVQVGDNVDIAAVISFDYDLPVDTDRDNTYVITETASVSNNPGLSLSSRLRTISETYTLEITDDPSDNAGNPYGEPPKKLFIGTLPDGYAHYTSGTTQVIPENADGSSNRITIGRLLSFFEGSYTLRLKETGTNDNSKFLLEDGILYFIGSTSGDFEDYYYNWQAYLGTDYSRSNLRIEVEYVSDQTAFYTESFVWYLRDENIPVTATEIAPNEFAVTTPESSEEIRITNINYTAPSQTLFFDSSSPSTYHAVRAESGGHRITLGGPDADKFHIDWVDGSPRNPLTVESRAGFDYENDQSAAGTNKYVFWIDSNFHDRMMYEITITDLEGALDPQMNDL
jgi:hypothetical protein